MYTHRAIHCLRARTSTYILQSSKIKRFMLDEMLPQNTFYKITNLHGGFSYSKNMANFEACLAGPFYQT